MSASILIVEDDLTFALMLKTWLGKKGFQVNSVSNMARARRALSEQRYDLILSDLRLPDEDGIALLNWMHKENIDRPLIIMTGYADIRSAVQAIKCGAQDYISKPIQPDELLKKIQEALKTTVRKPSSATTRNKQSAGITSQTTPSATIGTDSQNYLEGKSEAARQLYDYVHLVAPTQMSVLINGASGTGKEYVARRIHQLSKRADKPFIAIDCGSIPKELAASEFFGHVKGSFTGALTDKTGAFVEADGGTLFLDEIGNLGYNVQVQLLRALQERRIRPVGASKEIEVDVRVVCATNENLEQAIQKGLFREDLYHRINEFTLRMPSLKERQEDILLFANFFLDQANRELDRHLIGFDAQATAILQRNTWPGNLRQLRNAVKRATLLAQGDFITPKELMIEPLQTENDAVTPHTHSFLLHNEENEKRQIIEALRRTNNNKSKAALLLGIDRKTLYNKLKQYKLS